MDRSTAINDFKEAHRQASLKTVMSKIFGHHSDLYSYDEVLKKLRMRGQVQRGIEEIPLDAIIGSVGRYTDFTRDFLPKRSSDSDRWASVKMATETSLGVPPIEVYKLGETYFVKDGNHRVSIARQNGQSHIEAYITEVVTRVPITKDIKPDDLIIKSEYAEFLEYTQLDNYVEDVDLTVTAPGMYDELLDHISVHRYFMGIEQEREIPYEEAVVDWYKTVYLPVVEIVHERALLREFPDRTETDLYLWMLDYRAELENQLGWKLEPDIAANSLVERFSNRWRYLVRKLWFFILDLITPDTLESGPKTGTWRRLHKQLVRRKQSPIRNILVALQSQEDSHQAYEQALWIAQREGSRINGLHLVDSEAAKNAEGVQKIQDHFNWRLGELNIQGQLVVEVGTANRKIVEAAAFADLVVVPLHHAPGTEPFSKLRSGLRVLIRRCAQPLVVVPGDMRPIRNAVLAFDGSEKAKEALYMAAYLVQNWGMELTVLTVVKDENTRKQMEEANQFSKNYLQKHAVYGKHIIREGWPGEMTLAEAKKLQADCIIMGSYGANPLKEMVWGSAIDYVLEQTEIPVLISR
jgi:nucleotide-binding universal stress UspA family protein